MFSYHGYGRTGTILLSKTDDYFAYVDWLHEEMRNRVGRILPIWDTENGYGPRSNTRKYWLPNHEGFAPLDMARTLAVAFACERFKGVEKTFYYHGWHYALTEQAVLMNFHNVNGQLTPLTVTLPVAIQQLYGLRPVRPRVKDWRRSSSSPPRWRKAAAVCLDGVDRAQPAARRTECAGRSRSDGHPGLRTPLGRATTR